MNVSKHSYFTYHNLLENMACGKSLLISKIALTRVRQKSRIVEQNPRPLKKFQQYFLILKGSCKIIDFNTKSE